VIDVGSRCADNLKELDNKTSIVFDKTGDQSW
jgi:hypothetical protein